MASSTELYQVIYDGTIGLKKATEGGFNIFIDDEETDWDSDFLDAIEKAREYIVDDHLIIKGYGTHSGRKFWQLPDNIRLGILGKASTV